MEINEILKELRQRKHLTQQELATILDINLSSYQKYERPNNTIKPSIDALIKIADFYGVTVDYLLGREPAPLPANVMEVLGIEKSVDDDEFMRLYNELPDYAKQIFVDVMAKLAKAMEQAKPQLNKRRTKRLGDIDDALKQEETTQPVTSQSNIQVSKRAIARSKGNPFREAPTPEQTASFTPVPEDSDL